MSRGAADSAKATKHRLHGAAEEGRSLNSDTPPFPVFNEVEVSRFF